MRVICGYLFVALTACSSVIPGTAAAHEAVLRDVEGYAIASCLTYQQQAYLKDQGDGWASLIVQRSKGDVQALAAVAAVVKKQVAKGNMVIIRNEAGSEKDKVLPIAYCFEIINTPAVHSAINHAVRKLKKSYKASVPGVTTR